MGSSLVHRSWLLIIIILIVVLNIIINPYDNSEAFFFFFLNQNCYPEHSRSQESETQNSFVCCVVTTGDLRLHAGCTWERGTGSYVCNGCMGFQTPTTSKHSKLLSSVHHLLAVWPGNLFHANLIK